MFISLWNLLTHCLEKFTLKFNFLKNLKFPERGICWPLSPSFYFLIFFFVTSFLVYLTGFIEFLQTLISTVALLPLFVKQILSVSTTLTDEKRLPQVLNNRVFQAPPYLSCKRVRRRAEGTTRHPPGCQLLLCTGLVEQSQTALPESGGSNSCKVPFRYHAPNSAMPPPCNHFYKLLPGTSASYCN